MQNHDVLAHEVASRSLPPACPTVTPVLDWHAARDRHERRRLEGLIRERFAVEHGACIHHFLPRLFGLWQATGPVAAVGMQHAREGTLFVERYLDLPVEEALRQGLGMRTHRADIGEIGNLATLRPGLQRRLFLHLVEQLADEGVVWLVFAATPAVSNGLRRLGLDAAPLVAADPARLGRERHAWGRYYDRHPWVMVSNPQLARVTLREKGLLPIADAEVGHVG